MEALAHSAAPHGVTDLARALSMTKSNVHRLLRTLVELGYAHQHPASGLYDATIKFWELGFRIISKTAARSFAIPHMQTLAELTRETVNLAVLDNEEVVYIDRIDSVQPVRAHLGIGVRSPVYGIALGKAILAFQSEEYIERILGKLTRFTGATIGNAAEMRRELAQIRANGYAINRGEWREGVAGIAAPIHGSGNVTVAAIGISGPAQRFPVQDLPRLAKHVKAAANAVSASLCAVESKRPAARRSARTRATRKRGG